MNDMNKVMTYKDAGVDIEKADFLVERIKKKVKSTYGPRVITGVGGFASLYDSGQGKILAAGTDGVGTKLELAKWLDKHDTIGIDLVAMCVNDILCTGARPLFFMDYLATGALDIKKSEALIEGIVEGCRQAGMALIGGETAEMPGLYNGGDYDLAGFAVGEVHKNSLVDGQNIKEGDHIIGISSSGFHSNGFSLLRKFISKEEKNLIEKLLTPTKIYWPLVESLLFSFGKKIKGMAHITGGGWGNIKRISSQFDYKIECLPSFLDIPDIFQEMRERLPLSLKDLYQTFNMGVGFVMIVDPQADILEKIRAEGSTGWYLGTVYKGTGKVEIKDEEDGLRILF